MAAGFHFFPLLPWELRNQIWKLAIRPALPGAHVFRVPNANASEQNGPEHETADDDYSCISTSHPAAPQCLPKSVDFSPASQAAAPISWTLNNPSTYLIDSGLWTACKESLLVIEKEFQVRARREKVHVWGLSELEGFQLKRVRFTLRETATHVTSHNSGRRYLTVFPSQDLFIMQSLDVTAFDWQDWEVVWNSFHTYDFLTGDWQWNDPTGRHIAVEYDSVWDGSDRCFIGGIASNTAPVGAFTLWFIDYRIKRNPRYQEPTKEQPAGPGDPTVFYASDRRYVEVNSWQLGGWAGHNRMWDAGGEHLAEDPNEFSYPYRSGSDKFVNELEGELVDHCIYYEEMDHHNIWGSLGEITYGLLACECSRSRNQFYFVSDRLLIRLPF
ncbi:hypothetical protein B0T18DRAFT_460310 [Schizothecium vesticola]|uniref:2EXR domain-containing protein n=1 Tax=Schizothecium vesticola TaxID=314040 RepID=A0AA40F1H1_9PEZI|nr:hypothetical protein B0T18DRAFT_460310 [Schizothecium vesticola]